MTITYSNSIMPKKQEVFCIYDALSWAAYTRDMETTYSGIQNSLALYTAWDGEKLVGMLRAVGDGFTIVYIQDIIILPEYQRHGIGRKLMNMLFETFPQVRQKVLLTDTLSVGAISFYKSIGLNAGDDVGVISFVNFGG